ncbi:FliH/SctL family protein [Jeotgalibaca caeni]|uniref:FliH/SctL family protein n=1 Tax=Jeotgalibaca caeni TaxID=3028623 RepID=UPI00237E12B6|nr:FliH/SctL family protein [Jeotgalibaca caeni]MDE1548283.1 FliH/SctL family protein [Jeotgalibaca caeni]
MQSSLKVIKAQQSLQPVGMAKVQTELRVDETFEKKIAAKTDSKQAFYMDRMEQLVREAEAEKEQIILAAQEEAEQIKAAAQQEGYRIGEHAGREEGYQAGYQASIQAAIKEVERMKQAADQLLKDAAKEVTLYHTEKRHEIIELAAQMAEKIIHEKINTSDETIMGLIVPVLSRMEQESKFITISVSPEKAPVVKENIKTLEADFPFFRFAVLTDASLEENGCVIESPHAIMDLQIKQQLTAMVQDLQELKVDEHV